MEEVANQVTLFRFVRLCLKEAMRASWDTADYITTLIGAGLGAIAYFVPEWEEVLSHSLLIIPLAAFITVAIVRLSMSPYLVYRKLDREAKQSEAMVVKLTRPVIKASRVPPPQENYYTTGDSGLGFRIEVVNLSKGTTARNVEVKLVHIEPESHSINGLSLPLHQMNDNTHPQKTSFSLNPDDSKYIDVVGSRGRAQGIMVHHVVSGVVEAIPHGDYTLTIVATGEDIPSESVRLHVWDTDGSLHCELL